MRFAIQRTFRIYPALIFCLLAIYWISNALHQVSPTRFHTHFSINALWENLFLYKTTLHGASWTLQAEMLAVPFVFFAFCLFQKDRFFWTAFILTLLYGCLFAFYQPIGLMGFFFGFLVLLPKAKRFFSMLPPGFAFLFLFFTLSTKHFFPYDAGLMVELARRFLQGMSVFGLIAFVYYNERGLLIRCLNHPFSQYLGRISYSLYLFNVIGLHPLIEAMHFYFPDLCTHHSLTAGLGLGLVLSLITLPIADLCYRYIEKPGIRLGKWICQAGAFKHKVAQISYDVSSPASR